MSSKSQKSRHAPSISSSKSVVSGAKSKGSVIFDERHKFKGDRNETRLLIDQLEAYAKTLIVPYFQQTAMGLTELNVDENGWQYSGYHMLHSAEMCTIVTVPTVARPNLANITEQQSRKIAMELKFMEADSKNIRVMNDKRMSTSKLIIDWITLRLEPSLVILVQNLAKREQLTPASLFAWLKTHFAEQSHLEVIMSERRVLNEYCEATSMSAFVTTLNNRLATFHQLPSEGPEAEHEYVKEQIASLSFNFIMDSLMPERLKISERYKRALDLLFSDSTAKDCKSMVQIMDLFMSKCESIERGRDLAPVVMSAGALEVSRGDDGNDSPSEKQKDKDKICFAFRKNGECRKGDSCKYLHAKDAGGKQQKAAGGKDKASTARTCSKNNPCGNMVCHFCRERFVQEIRENLLAEGSEDNTSAANSKKRPRESSLKENWVQKPKDKKTGIKFLDVHIDDPNDTDLNICVNAARVHLDDSGGLAMMDSGCSENVVPAEMAEIWGRIEHCAGSCRTVSGEKLPIQGLVGLPGGLPGRACVVKGVKEPLLSVRAFTAMGVSICFPALDLGTEWGFYGYKDDRIVLVGDFDYMVHLEHVVGTCDDMPAMVPPIFPDTPKDEESYVNALNVYDSEGDRDVESGQPYAVAGTCVGTAVSGAVTAGTAVAGAVAVDTARGMNARAVHTGVSVAASTGVTGVADPGSVPDLDLRTGLPHKVGGSMRSRSGSQAVAAITAVSDAVDTDCDHSVRVGLLSSVDKSNLTAGRTVTYAQSTALPGNRGCAPRMLSDQAAAQRVYTQRVYTQGGVTPAGQLNGPARYDVASGVATGSHAAVNRA